MVQAGCSTKHVSKAAKRESLRHSEVCIAEARDRFGKVYQPPFCGEVKHTESASDSEAFALRSHHALTIIHDHKGGVD
jgi:hypothetical protein